MSFAAEVPSPAVLHADVGAGLRITLSQLPPAALSTLKHAASMANPKFYELQRLRKSTWDTPRFVRGDDITLDDHLSCCPVDCGIPSRPSLSGPAPGWSSPTSANPGSEIDVVFTATLKPEQAVAVGVMLAHDDGVLVAPPGSGRTVMACAIIAERATSTLVLVDRKAVAEQRRTHAARCSA